MFRVFMKQLLVLLFFGLLATQVSQASTLVFDFSFTTQRGNLPGTVTASIYGLDYNGPNQSAFSVVIESYPNLPLGAYSDLEDGKDAALWSNVNNNSFDVVDGEITGYLFVSSSTSFNIPGANYNQFLLVDRGGISSSVGAGFNWLSFRQSSEPFLYAAASDERFSIFSPRQQTTPIPLPASLSLVLAGLAGLGWVARRKKSKAM